MDNEGKKILEAEVESIMQSIPEWVKYIPQNDEIRMQISAIYHAVHGYTHKRKEGIGAEIDSSETAEDVHKYTHEEGTIIDKEYFTKFFDLAAQYNIFSGKIRGWSKPKDDYSVSDYVDERNRLRSVEKSILLLIEEIKSDAHLITIESMASKAKARKEVNQGITIPKCIECIEDMINTSFVEVDKPKCKIDTLRRKIQNHLNSSQCESITIRGKTGKYYKVEDVAQAAEKYYTSFTSQQYIRTFLEVSLPWDDIQKKSIKNI